MNMLHTLKPSQKKTIELADAIAQKTLTDIDQIIGYSSNIFMMFGLPTKRLPAGQNQWVRESRKYSLTVTQVAKNFEVPYGCYARMNQIFLDTEIKTKATNLINLGNSFNEYAKKVGYHEGYAYRGLKTQLANLIRCAISITSKDEHIDAGVQTLVGKKWFIALDEHSPDQPELFHSRILLDKDYTDYIFRHAVPLDMTVVRFFKRNPLALDFYRFLAYRSNDLNKPLSLPDTGLFDQLGTTIADPKVTRIRLKRILEQIQVYWKVQAKFEDGFFHLLPSPPAVEQKSALSRRLHLVDNLDEK